MAIVAVSIAPNGIEGLSLSKYVALTQEVLEQENLHYRLDPMFTTIEGDIDEIFSAIRKMQEAVFAAGAQRVSTVIKIDDRRDREVRMDDKVRAVEDALKKQESSPN